MSPRSDPNPKRVELAPEDAAALDALIESRALGPRPVSPALRSEVDADRADAVASWMSLLDQCPAAEAPDDLVRGTLRRVTRHHSMDLDAARLRIQGRGVGMPARLREIMAVAAMLIVGVSLVLPVLARTRHESMRVACQARLATVGRAFAQYASDHLGNMPRRHFVEDSRWFNVGWTRTEEDPVKANSANLYLLARLRYVEPATLACPAKDRPAHVMTAEMHDWPSMDDVSYSYHNQYAPRATRLGRRPHLAVLADKNPRFVIRNGVNLMHLETMPEHSASLSHKRRGQNVLFADGGVKWCVSPVMPNGDNIWLARGVSYYDGTEIPSGDDDAFLVP